MKDNEDPRIEALLRWGNEAIAERDQLRDALAEAERDRNAVVILFRAGRTDEQWAAFPERLQDLVDAEYTRLRDALEMAKAHSDIERERREKLEAVVEAARDVKLQKRDGRELPASIEATRWLQSKIAALDGASAAQEQGK